MGNEQPGKLNQIENQRRAGNFEKAMHYLLPSYENAEMRLSKMAIDPRNFIYPNGDYDKDRLCVI